MSLWAVLFFLVLGLGLASGVVRDWYSSEQRERQARVVNTAPEAGAYRWPTSPPSIKAMLSSGELVDVYTRGGTEPAVGSTVTVRELKAPWGPLWYKLKG